MVKPKHLEQIHCGIEMRECEQERSWELYKVLRTLERSREPYKEPRRSPGRPVRANETTRNYAPAQGVSTRKLSYLFGELRGEYERFPIRPPSGSPTIRTYVRSPLRRGSRVETRTPAHTTY
jgi:hypothetical protein